MGLQEICDRGCVRCDLHKTAKTVCVPGRGADTGVRLVLIGEAPGPQEDIRGLPFVGNAGQKLDSLIEQAGVDPYQIRFENIVRCFPTKEDGSIRPPTNQERDSCLPYLFKVLDHLATSQEKPPILVALGNTALTALTGMGAITRNRGVEFPLIVPEALSEWKHLGDIYKVIGTIHPAAVLRGRETDGPKIAEDLKLAWDKSSPDGTTISYADGYIWVTSAEEWEGVVDSMIGRVKSGEVPFVAWDFETTGLDPYSKDSRIVALSVCCEAGKAFVVPFFHKDSPWATDEFLSSRVVAASKRLLWSVPGAVWNGKFDIKWAFLKWGPPAGAPSFPPIAIDGMLAHHWSWGSRKPHDLNSVASDELGFLGHGKEMHATLAAFAPEARHMGNVDSKILLQYAGGDADATYQLSIRYLKYLEKTQALDNYKRLMVDGIDVMAELEVNGLCVDPMVTAYLDADYPKRMLPLEEKVRNSPWGQETIKVLQSRPKPLLFSLGSTETLQELLFNQMKLSPGKLSQKTGKPSADREVLDALVESMEGKDETPILGVLQAIREWRTLRKYHATYVKKMPTYTKSDGYFHTNYNLSGTETGRHSSSDPSLHTIPKGADVRLQFISRWRKKGGLILSSDLSQAEVRVAASLSDEESLIEIVNSGVDMHSANASRIFQVPVEEVTKKQRQIAKTVSFACVPMDTKCLTSTGWSGYESVNVGDTVLGYDSESGTTRWTTVLEKVRYDDAPLVRMSNDQWSVVSTPNHRWYGRTRAGRGRTRRYEDRVFTTEEITTEHTITRSASLFTTGGLRITPEESELFGWVLGDGCVKVGRGTGPSQAGGKKLALDVFVSQSKAPGLARLRLVSAGLPVREWKSPTRGGYSLFRLSPSYARDLWSRLGLPLANKCDYSADDLCRVVLSMSPSQVSGLLAGFVGSEGTITKRGVPVISQNEGPILEAILLASFLCGCAPSKTSPAVSRFTGKLNWDVRLCKPTVTGQRLTRSVEPNAPVWCIRTELGSWVIRQGDTISITGNTLYGASPQRVAVTAGISEPEAERIIGDFFKAFPGLHKWMGDVYKFAQREGFVFTPFGRIRWIDKVQESKWGGREWRQCINTPIQSVASDITYQALQEVVRRVRSLGLSSKIFGFIHDSIVADVAPGELRIMVDLLKYYMVTWTNAQYPWMKAKMVSEFEICPGWGYPCDLQWDGEDTYTVKGSSSAIYCLRRELAALGVLPKDTEVLESGAEVVKFTHRWPSLSEPF